MSVFGEENGNAKLLNSQVVEIKSLLLQGLTGTEIAKRFGVSKACISRIKCGNRRKQQQEAIMAAKTTKKAAATKTAKTAVKKTAKPAAKATAKKA